MASEIQVSPSPAAEPADRSLSPSRPWWHRVLVAMPVLVLALFAVVATAVPAAQDRELSILDEVAHVDSVFKVPSIGRSGEVFRPETLDQVSCRGGIAQWPDWEPPPCGIPQGVPPTDYQVGSGGYNTADIHPPVYYFVTAALSTAAGWLVDADPVTLMRLTGSLYLAIGVCLAWLLARRLGANRWAAFGACGLLVAAPSVQYMSSIVNVDAAVIMAAAAFGLLTLTVWRRRSAWWLMPLLAMALMLVKMTNLGALIAVALFVILTEATAPIRSTRQLHGVPADLGPDAVAVERAPVDPSDRTGTAASDGLPADDTPTSTSTLALDHVTHASGADTGVRPANDQATEITGHARGWPTHSPAIVLTRWRANTSSWLRHNGRGTLRAIGLTAFMAVGAVVVTIGWTKVQNYRAIIPSSELWFTQQFNVDHLEVHQIGDSALQFWEPTGLWFPWLSAKPYMGSILLMITSAVPLALAVAAWFRDRGTLPILVSSLITMAIAAPVYVLMNYVVNGVYFNPDFRYGLSILPFFAVAVAAGLRTRLAGAVLSGLAVFGMVTTLVTLL